MNSTINLLPSSILHIPLHQYEKNFTFIVNNQKYQTSRIIADLLSPKIAQYHLVDPSISEYTINTIEKGDFQAILNISNFKQHEISVSELPFLSEIFEKLDIQTFSYKIKTFSMENVNVENVIEILKEQQLHRRFYFDLIAKEIEFIASHFVELQEKLLKERCSLSKSIFEEIISSPMLKLDTENQLLDFINELYYKDSTFSTLYSYVIFANVSSEKMKEFIQLIDLADINRETWDSLADRLLQKTIKNSNDNDLIQIKSRERNKPPKSIVYESGCEFKGVFNFLKKESTINEEVEITYSSKGDGSSEPENLLLFEDPTKNFYTDNLQNSWICFEFKKRKIIPLNYTIRTYNWTSNVSHLKSWVIEGSNDNSNWLVVDEEIDCPFLNGKSFVHTFNINNEQNKPFKYLRIRQTGPNWANYNFLKFDSIEFYGTLI